MMSSIFQTMTGNFSLKEVPFYLKWSGPAFTDTSEDGNWGEGMVWECTIMVEDEDGEVAALSDIYPNLVGLDSASFTPDDGDPSEETIYRNTEDRLTARFGVSREDAGHIDYGW